jgi:hypothetical protein
MASLQEPPPGPDFATAGIALTDLADGEMMRGHANREPVLMVRRGDDIVAVGAACTHYGGPIVQRSGQSHLPIQNIEQIGEIQAGFEAFGLDADLSGGFCRISANFIGLEGDRACSIAFRRNGKTLAVASVKRDLENLEAEVALEANDEAARQRIVAAQ